MSNSVSSREKISTNSLSLLDEVIKEGARKILQQAIENEVAEYIESFQHQRDEINRRIVTRNGYLPERNIQTGVGNIPIEQPRVRHRDGGKFTSSLLPPYVRRTPSIESVIPTLYLKGISTLDFPAALEALLGENAKGLSPTNIVRLKEVWMTEYTEWQQRDLSGKEYVYIWVDGIHFNIRLDDDRPCVLVVIGALADGTKEMIAIQDGERESKLSWKEVLLKLKARGLTIPPNLAVGDGALGFWAALVEVWPSTKQQRCWVHKTVNILDKLPKSVHGQAKNLIHEMYLAPKKVEAIKAYNTFLGTYNAKYPKACECLKKDFEVLFTFYDYPAVHWQHIRTTNPIESTFATIRHRTRQTKGCGSRTATLSMVYKLAMSAQKRWRKLRGYELISKVVAGVKFVDGEEVKRDKVVA